MKKIICLALCLCLYGAILAQTLWIRNYDTAIGLALKSHKLIIVDFWAAWCGPCLVMDQKLWANDEMKKLSQNFVLLRLNSDYDLSLVSKYGVRSIPRVIVITAGEDVILDKMGFMNAENYLERFKCLPANIGEINILSMTQAENRKDVSSNIALGREFQRIGREIMDSEIKTSFLICSDKYLKRAANLSKEADLSEEIELHLLLNEIYAGRHEKALKTIEKMDSAPSDPNLSELRHFVFAQCYKCNGDSANFLKNKQLVTKPDLISQLNK